MLRNRQFRGLKFRRQHPIEQFIADFYCEELRLVVEFDGPVHEEEEAKKWDRSRDRILRGNGYEVLRVRNALLVKDPRGFLEVLDETVERILAAKTPHPGPLPEGEGARPATNRGDVD